MFIAAGATRALKTLVTFIDRKARAPRDHVLLTPAPGGHVTISATDGSTTVGVALPCAELVTVCVPAKELLAALRAVPPKAKVKLEVIDGRLVVASPGMSATLNILAAAPADFEIRVQGDQWEHRRVDAAAFVDALRWTAQAMCTDDATRIHLAGVLLDGENLVATDGKRLHIARVPGMTGGPLLMPAKVVDLLLRTLPSAGEVDVAINGGVVQFSGAGWIIRTPAAGHLTFPPYKDVIPKPSAATFTMSMKTTLLAAALTRVGVRRKGSSPLAMCCNGRIMFSTVGEAIRRIATLDVSASTHDPSTDDVTIGIDGRFLRDAVACEGCATIRFPSDVCEPLVVDSEHRLAVVMPMRL